MLVELGHLAMWMALGSALTTAALTLRATSIPVTTAEFTTQLTTALVCLAFGILVAAFQVDDFSVLLVASHSHSDLPWYYKLGAVWGNHEGSLLLWILVLGVWSVLLAGSEKLPAVFRIRTLGVLGGLQSAFIGFSLFTSNPFARILPSPPAAGAELNPLLQDVAMMMHPPLLYIGYVGFAIPFALAVAALLAPKQDKIPDWSRWARPWTLAAWAFLSVGIALGSWWAYYELGWGGWWFWDPVENASLMPWLCGIALFHSLLASERRNIFQSWSILLAISCFGLSLLGTFLVRSGVLVSVHAFAADPARGLYLLLLLLLTMVLALLLFRRRAELLAVATDYRLFSREMALWLNNLLLIAALLTVLAGTLFPLLALALDLGTWSVGAAYFNTVLTPLALVALIVMAPASSLAWRKQQKIPGIWALWLSISIVAALGWSLFVSVQHWSEPLVVAVLCWLVLLTVANLRRYLLGSAVAHLGVAVCAIGIAVSSWYGQVADVSLSPGESARLGNYDFRMEADRELRGTNYQATELSIAVSDGQGRELAQLKPQKRWYPVRKMHLSETDIAVRWHGDLYVTPGEPVEGGGWTLRLQYKPLIRLIWLGFLMMAVGAILSAGRLRRT